MAELSGGGRGVRIIPFRGEYFRLRPEAQGLIRHLIYPVPDAVYPFLGVHFTRLIAGGVEAGPNAVLALAREGYHKRDIKPSRHLGFAHLPWSVAVSEDSFVHVRRGDSSGHFRCTHSETRSGAWCRSCVMKIWSQAGPVFRAQAMTRAGTLVEDFVFVQRPRALRVVNAPSPGATASLAIADEIVRMIGAA